MFISVESKGILTAGMFGCCCMPCTIYSTAESLDQSGILCMLLGCGMPWVATWILRGKAREKYGIDVRTIKHKQILYLKLFILFREMIWTTFSALAAALPLSSAR